MSVSFVVFVSVSARVSVSLSDSTGVSVGVSVSDRVSSSGGERGSALGSFTRITHGTCLKSEECGTEPVSPQLLAVIFAESTRVAHKGSRQQNVPDYARASVCQGNNVNGRTNLAKEEMDRGDTTWQ